MGNYTKTTCDICGREFETYVATKEEFIKDRIASGDTRKEALEDWESDKMANEYCEQCVESQMGD